MRRWRVAITVYPHATGNGSEADKKAAGATDDPRYFYVEADDFGEAVKMAKCFQQGVASHPAVWQANILGVHVYDR